MPFISFYGHFTEANFKHKLSWNPVYIQYNYKVSQKSCQNVYGGSLSAIMHYWVNQKLPRIYTANHATFPIRIRKLQYNFAVTSWSPSMKAYRAPLCAILSHRCKDKIEEQFRKLVILHTDDSCELLLYVQTVLTNFI